MNRREFIILLGGAPMLVFSLAPSAARFLYQAHTWIVEDPHAMVFVWCNDVDCVHARSSTLGRRCCPATASSASKRLQLQNKCAHSVPVPDFPFSISEIGSGASRLCPRWGGWGR
jgi:hypothetical protein